MNPLPIAPWWNKPLVAAVAVAVLLHAAVGGLYAQDQVPKQKKPATLVAPEAGKSKGQKSSGKKTGSPAGKKPSPSGKAASPKSARDPAAKSLDDELLGELSDGLFGPVEDELFRQGVQKTKKPAPDPKSKDKSLSPGGNPGGGKSTSPQQLPELVQPEGEDIGPQDNPLASISRQMQQVQRLLASRQLDQRTLQMQQEIVRRLEKLLQQARRNRTPRSGAHQRQSASRNSTAHGQRQLPSGSQPAGSKPRGQQAARRPNPQAEQTQEKRPKTPEPKEKKRNLVQDLIKRIWGHLPPRMRQQMLQSATDRFLPQYQLEIEEYFKRVSRVRSEEP